MNAPEWEEAPIGACIRDPERWTTRADEEAKAICRECPRRWLCVLAFLPLPIWLPLPGLNCEKQEVAPVVSRMPNS